MDSISIQEAVNEYLADKRPEVTDTIYANHKHRLRMFLQWCEENGVEGMRKFRGHHLHELKKWRAEDLKPNRLKNQLGTARLVLQFCERLEVAPMGINQLLALPDIGPQEEGRETIFT